MNQTRARAAVLAAGSLWRVRYVAWVERDTPATRAALRKANDRLDEAIANQFDTIYAAEFGRKGTP